ncbi:MAG: hypothetical protein A3H28_11270 [Acidobacteria bacterium RIFCSPLOWO2_02_FULL_61_28]|nr:MAG: hypothetical protein A3H28_11270 [Acidobacteria bacterium RIFCSPLOWO2_02_FULL_61_28]
MGVALLVRDRDRAEVYRETVAGYTEFHEFRVAWADLLGTDLNQMDGYGGRESWEEQPLQSFFDHSDCEGKISWRAARTILRQARKDAPRLQTFNQQFTVLISACEKAIQHRTPIIFC